MWFLRFFSSVFICFGNHVLMWISGRWDCQIHHLANHTGILLLWIVYFLVSSILPLKIWNMYKFGNIFFSSMLWTCVFLSLTEIMYSYSWTSVFWGKSECVHVPVSLFSFSFVGKRLKEWFILTDSNFSPLKLLKPNVHQICCKLLLPRYLVTFILLNLMLILIHLDPSAAFYTIGHPSFLKHFFSWFPGFCIHLVFSFSSHCFECTLLIYLHPWDPYVLKCLWDQSLDLFLFLHIFQHLVISHSLVPI